MVHFLSSKHGMCSQFFRTETEKEKNKRNRKEMSLFDFTVAMRLHQLLTRHSSKCNHTWLRYYDTIKSSGHCNTELNWTKWIRDKIIYIYDFVNALTYIIVEFMLRWVVCCEKRERAQNNHKEFIIEFLFLSLAVCWSFFSLVWLCMS